MSYAGINLVQTKVISLFDNVFLSISLEISQQFLKFSNQTPLPIYLSQTKVNQLNCKLTQSINNKKSYVQTSKINQQSSPVRFKVNMTTKRPSRKQVIISISKSNTNIIRSNANFHINSINKHFKDANLNTLVLWQPLDTKSNNYTNK